MFTYILTDRSYWFVNHSEQFYMRLPRFSQDHPSKAYNPEPVGFEEFIVTDGGDAVVTHPNSTIVTRTTAVAWFHIEKGELLEGTD